MNTQLLKLFGYLAGDSSLKDNPDYGKKPGEIDYNYKGDPSSLVANPYLKPSGLAAFTNPSLMEDYNKFEYAGPIAEMKNTLATKYAPQENQREVARQRALKEADFEFDKSKWGELDKHQLDFKKMQTDQEKADNTTKASLARAQGALPPSLTGFSDEYIGNMIHNLDQQNLLQEATAKEKIGMGLPSAAAKSALAQENYQSSFYPNRTTEQGATAATYKMFPDLLQKKADNELFGDVFKGTHGVSVGDLTSTRTLPTVSPTGVTTAPNPTYVSPTVAAMQDAQDAMKSFSGSTAPHLKALDALGIPKISASVPLDSAPVRPTATVPVTTAMNAGQNVSNTGLGAKIVAPSEKFPPLAQPSMTASMDIPKSQEVLLAERLSNLEQALTRRGISREEYTRLYDLYQKLKEQSIPKPVNPMATPLLSSGLFK